MKLEDLKDCSDREACLRMQRAACAGYRSGDHISVRTWNVEKAVYESKSVYLPAPRGVRWLGENGVSRNYSKETA